MAVVTEAPQTRRTPVVSVKCISVCQGSDQSSRIMNACVRGAETTGLLSSRTSNSSNDWVTTPRGTHSVPINTAAVWTAPSQQHAFGHVVLQQPAAQPYQEQQQANDLQLVQAEAQQEPRAHAVVRACVSMLGGLLFLVGSVAFWPSFGHTGSLIGAWGRSLPRFSLFLSLCACV